MIWVAVGGRGTLVGAILGVLLVNTGKSAISSARPDIWQFIVGALFVGVVLLFPNGLIGAIKGLWNCLPKNMNRVPALETEVEPPANLEMGQAQ